MERRLRWLEISFLILTIPAFYMELASGDVHSIVMGRWFYGVAGVGTLATLLLLSRFSAHRLPFFRSNWLSVLIGFFALANVIPTPLPWTAWEWFLRGSLAILAAGVAIVTPVRADEALAKKHICLAYHQVDKKSVGPAYKDIAIKYQGQAGMDVKLAEKVKKGGQGDWGPVPMPPNAAVPDADIKKLVDWILKMG